MSTESESLRVRIDLDAVIVSVIDSTPRLLTINADQLPPVLPHGPLDPGRDTTLEKALRAWVRQSSGLQMGYVEQLYTFGDINRVDASVRAISVAYLALVRQEASLQEQDARWVDWYRFFPWEDWRNGRPAILDERIVPGLEGWLSSNPEERPRVDLEFGLGGAPWDAERCLDRYEILYQAGLVGEAGARGDGNVMGRDHRRILATAMGRLRGKLRYRPLVFELLPQRFTLLHLQHVVEALAGSRLHKQNFRRLVSQQGLVEPTGKMDTTQRGRPAELFAFRSEVMRERPAPGISIAGAKWR